MQAEGRRQLEVRVAKASWTGWYLMGHEGSPAQRRMKPWSGWDHRAVTLKAARSTMTTFQVITQKAVFSGLCGTPFGGVY